ncbi:DUF3656 domain-containing protein [Butyrivibrio sp. JL13D10]|uniref:U32 family peptidase n=1 Tax=Butyrivibrio sp. JL13D10 TaxID=3236815 RepID=UPI0038B459E3
MNKKVELLAPAGNYETMLGAFNAGADAVYLGGQGFGARAFADNFTNEEVISAIKYAHLHGKKIYLTVNTLLKENEITAFKEFFEPFAYAGLDGAIIQDFGIFRMIREEYPWVELHVSTQMTITGEKGARLLMDLGASRVVPARELSLSEIKRIHENCKFEDGRSLEIEAFIHGAMCYCYSGACLFSSMVGERSGNRGRCAQPCRLPYRTGKKGECYPLSLKDMCMASRIPELIEAGIDSFKIEGRMKKPEYAAGVTSVYRKYIDKYYELKAQDLDKSEAAIKIAASDKDKKILSSLYLRSEIGEGYYFRHNGPDMITLDNPAYNGSDDKVLENVRSRFITGEKKIDVELSCTLKIDTPSELTIKTGDSFLNGDAVSVTVRGDMVQKALNKSMAKEDIEKQISKLGNTPFAALSLDVSIDNNGIFIPNKSLNELRRRACSELIDAILLKRGYKNFYEKNNIRDDNAMSALNESDLTEDESILAISVMDYSQLNVVCKYFNDNNKQARIYVDSQIILLNQDISLVSGCEFYAALPYILRKEEFFDGHDEINRIISKLDNLGFKGVLVRNTEELQIIKESGYKGEIILDYGLYIWNHDALTLYKECAGELSFGGFNLPLELNSYEMSDLLENMESKKPSAYNKKTGIQVYGRVPMMVTANCLKNTLDKCSGNRGKLCEYEKLGINDRTGRTLPVSYDCMHCCNIIWNSVPVSLFKKTKKLKSMADKYSLLYRLDFTVEKPLEITNILRAYDAVFYSNDKKVIRSAEDMLSSFDYTAGHFERSAD